MHGVELIFIEQKSEKMLKLAAHTAVIALKKCIFLLINVQVYINSRYTVCKQDMDEL